MLNFALTAVASILFVVDPIATVPVYLVLTEADSPAKRRRTALLASITATLTMAGFAAGGGYLFRMIGLTLPAFQIAGGSILFLVALDMIRAQRSTHEGPAEIKEGQTKEDITITPLAIPMLVGPAALSTVATLMNQARTFELSLVVFLAIVAAGLVTYLTLLMASPLHRWLGHTGINVLSRFMGLVLAGYAIQFVLDGVMAAGLVPNRQG